MGNTVTEVYFGSFMIYRKKLRLGIFVGNSDLIKVSPESILAEKVQQ